MPDMMDELNQEFEQRLDSYIAAWRKDLEEHLSGGDDEPQQFAIGESKVDAQDAQKEEIVRQATTVAAVADSEIRRRIDDLLKKKYLPAGSEGLTSLLPTFLADFEQLLRDVEPVVAQSIAETLLAGWTRGASDVVESHGAPHLVPLPPTPPPPAPPTTTATAAGEPPEPLLTFPGLEAAARNLEQRQILSPAQYYQLDATAKQRAFTISADLTERSLTTIRTTLAENFQSGTSRAAFARAVREAVTTLPISESHLEQVYRNNVNAAYSRGKNDALAHPIVGSGFPYRGYYPIHDRRCRAEHRALEHLGIDGTYVYHKDDPTWRKFEPPWAWGCRCGWNPLSIRQAARAGVREAQEWLDTGIEPAHVWVQPPPFSPPASWDRQTVGIGA